MTHRHTVCCTIREDIREDSNCFCVAVRAFYCVLEGIKHESPTRSARLAIQTIHSVLHGGEYVPEDAVRDDLGFGGRYVSVADGGTDVFVA